jgi:glycosyltransferase involved in cell wall biosynthesis
MVVQDFLGEDCMKSLVIRAPLLTFSGYGTHSRQIFRWARDSKFFNKIMSQPVPWGITTWMINPDGSDGLVGDIMKSTSSPKPGDTKPDVSIQVILPNEWDPNLAKINVGITAAVETDRCNPDWIVACNRMNAIIVPSNHTKSVLENSGHLNVPMYVVPESFIDAIDNENHDQLKLDLNTEFNFLTVGQVTGQNPENDRKNVFYLIKWFCEEFKDDSQVGLVIKTNSGKNTKIDKKMTEQMMESLLSEIRKGPYPAIHLLHGSMTEDEMAALYRQKSIKAFVSLTRGEGFGLPLLESAASALPVIVTDWSAHLDFLKKGKYVGIDYELKEVDKSRIDGMIFISGSRWANPLEHDFKRKIAKFRKNSEIPKKWAVDLQRVIKNEYSQKAICKIYEKVFSEIIK